MTHTPHPTPRATPPKRAHTNNNDGSMATSNPPRLAAAGAGHDLNNLLAIIRLSAETLRDADLDTHTQVLHLRRVLDAADEGFELAKRLLNLGAATHDAASIVDMNELIETVGAVLRHLAGPRIDVVVEPEAGRADVRTDCHRVRQSLLNLGRNAIDEIDGDGRISLSTRSHQAGSDGDPGWLQLEVADSGRGIAKGVATTLFDPFVTTRLDGNGLGLSIVRDTVTAAGGTIEARNRPEGGASFVMLFPLAAELALRPRDLARSNQ